MPRSALFSIVLCLITSTASSQSDSLYEHEAIAYSTSEPQNQVAELKHRLEHDQVDVTYDNQFGWLPGLLKELDIDRSTQSLVFSKTSLQRNAISPHSPRALYFNDTTYVGYPNGGDIIEISVADPELGAVFYSIKQSNRSKLILLRETDRCLACHASSAHTRGVPGHIVRSVYPDAEGFPELALGSFRITPESPMQERWGGWFVTGRVGENQHLGNRWLEDSKDIKRFDASNEPIATWPSKVDPQDYLTHTSDIGALLILEHQVALHNQFTESIFSAKRALWDERVLDEAFDEQEAGLRDSTLGRIDRTAKKLAESLLGSNEAELKPGVVLNEQFALDFAKRGPKDSQGRSLRNFDLQSRMLRYPCSYLIYSDSFTNLPDELKQAVVGYVEEWLISGIPNNKNPFPPELRAETLEILRETHPDFAESSSIRQANTISSPSTRTQSAFPSSNRTNTAYNTVDKLIKDYD